jgi:hypothetical protein
MYVVIQYVNIHFPLTLIFNLLSLPIMLVSLFSL